MQRLPITKVLPSTTASNVPHTFWKSTGIPGAGADPSAGLAGAVTCSSATTGAILYTNPTSPATMHIVGIDMYSATAGTLILVDRLAHANVAINQTTGAFSPVIDGTARLDAGEGAMIMCEVTGALSAASNSFTLTYTDEVGTSSTTPTVATVASAIVGRAPYVNYLWVPLASGDKGARTITNWTLTSGTATGNINIVLAKPLASVSILSSGSMSQKDFVVELPSLPRIKDNSCLMFYFVPSGAATAVLAGEVRIVEN